MAALVAAFFMFTSPVAAQAECGKRSDVIAFLENKYAEQLHAVALTAGDWLLEVFVSRSGETWTLIVTDSLGVSCVKATGKNWRLAKSLPKGQEL